MPARPRTGSADHLLAALWTLLVGVLLLLPDRAVPPLPAWAPEAVERGADKLTHAGLFFVAALVYRRSARHLLDRLDRGAVDRRALALAAAAALGYGAALELAQGLVPRREPGVGDALADAAGVALYVVLALAGARPAPPASRSA